MWLLQICFQRCCEQRAKIPGFYSFCKMWDYSLAGPFYFCCHSMKSKFNLDRAQFFCSEYFLLGQFMQIFILIFTAGQWAVIKKMMVEVIYWEMFDQASQYIAILRGTWGYAWSPEATHLSILRPHEGRNKQINNTKTLLNRPEDFALTETKVVLTKKATF